MFSIKKIFVCGRIEIEFMKYGEYIDYWMIALQMVRAIYRQNHRYQSICEFMTIKNYIQYITVSFLIKRN